MDDGTYAFLKDVLTIKSFQSPCSRISMKMSKINFLMLIMVFALLGGCHQEQKPDPSQELKPIIDKYAELWNTGNVSELDAIMDPDFIYHSDKLPAVNGIDGIKKVKTSFRTAYPDLKLVVEDDLFSENEAVGRWKITGTNTGTGEMPLTEKSVDI